MAALSHRVARPFLRTVVRRVAVGSLEVRWSDGTEETFSGDVSGPAARIEVRDEAALLTRLIDDGGLGLGIAYLHGAWDTPDLAGFLELASRNVDIRQATSGGSRMMSAARSFWDKRPSFVHSRPIEEIGEHYNLGNEFYAAWLDPTMSYSSARFTSPDMTLEEAQREKYRSLCELLDLQPGDRVLEIGCGWGGFMQFAATEFDVHVTGLTLSQEMATFAQKRLAEAGLADRTEVKLQDFRHELGMYDKVVSIEMIESVDETVWPSLFHAIARALRPGGMAAMQAITIDPRYYENLLVREDFIKRYIFPGGALPTVEVLQELAADAGMAWLESSSHGTDYADTLALWAESFQAAWPGIQAADSGFDERFRRMWHYYLQYCEAGFRTGRIDGIQFAMERPAPAS